MGNYATLNPLDKGAALVLADGNLKVVSVANDFARSTIAVSSGKWYAEYTHGTGLGMVGVADKSGDISQYLGQTSGGYGYYSAGTKYSGGASSYANSYTTGDVIGIAFDADNGTLTFYKNNTSQGTAFTGLTSGPYFFAAGIDTMANSVMNFGQRAFAYTAPSGYKCLNTANLPDPTIADGSTAFDTVTYDGTQVTRSITGLDFGPDLVWTKSRSNTTGNELYDSVRGAQELLYSNLTDAETTVTNGISSFNSDGWTMGNRSALNNLGRTYVGWAWDAGSSVETLSAGDKNSQFVNQDQLWSSYGTFSNDNSTYNWTAVFSLASHFSTGGSMYNNGPSPATWVLTSGLSCSNTISFYVFGTNVSMTINYGLSDETTFVSSGYNRNYTFTMPFTGTIQNIRMNTGATYLGRIAVDGKMLIDNNLTFNVPSSSTSITKNDSAGFSITKFNSGTGASDPSPYIGGGYDYVYHGLNKPPEFIITKSLDSAQDWAVWHEKLSNAPSSYLKLNQSHALASSNYWSPQIEIYEMGQTQSAVAGDYISYNWTSVEGYSAFGSYTGNGVADGPFVYTGFAPAFVLIKNSSVSGPYWTIFDNKRGSGQLYPNEAIAESYYPGNTTDPRVLLTSNGFKMTVAQNTFNGSGNLMVFAAFAENPFKTSRAR